MSPAIGAYRVATITSHDELTALDPRWHRLLLESATASAYASPAWLRTWYRHYQPRSGIYVVTVWRGDELVGVAPFARSRAGRGRAGFSLLVSAGTEHGDYGDPLLGPDPRPVARAVADHLVHLVRHENTAVNLRRLRDDSLLLALLEGRDDVACEPMGIEAANAVVRFADLDDPAAALARTARKRDLPRLRRRLTEAYGEVAFVGDAPDTAAALDHMRDFLDRRWGPGEGPRLFATPGREAFTRDVTTALVASGLARVSLLTAGGRTLAVTIVHRVGDRVLGDATGLDPDFRRYSAGLLNLHDMLAGALAEGAAEYDMRGGDFPYKDQWATTSRRTRSIAVVRPGRPGRRQLTARRLVMSARARRLARDERAAPPVARAAPPPRPPTAPAGASPPPTPADGDRDAPRISVVIPARNAAEWLDQQLAALARQQVPVPWEVVVADNGSTDATRALAEGWRDRMPVRVVDASRTGGINHARNRGAAEARGDLLLFCDADDVVSPGWVAAYWQARDGWDMAGGTVDATSLNEPGRRSLHLGSSLHGLNGFGWMETFMGCNFAVHRRVHAAIGGFDESFRGGGDDMDFAFRGQLAGHRLGFVADAVVAYRVRDSLRAAARQHYRYGRTRPQLYRKFRASGMPRRSWKHTVRTYGLAVAQSPRVLSADGRGRWVLRVSF
ncbi:MAG TPA: GNAT family N-acetyltransferase, partial [Acidimicrobiales bacterium]